MGNAVDEPYYFNFHIYIASVVQNYPPNCFDITNVHQQLWEAAVNKHKTDVVFKVGHSSFPAHKFILAARSSQFKAMFDAHQRIEFLAGLVIKMVEFEPKIIKNLLYFLYTGQLVNQASRPLRMTVKIYNVKTLASLCRTAVAANKIKDHQLDWTKKSETSVKENKILCNVNFINRTEFFKN